MNHDRAPSSSKVTLEDLLRLKRAERPAQEFWVEFERDLRAKQLAAIVEKRPWWYWAPPLMAKFSHLQVPLGATAALAVTLLTVHEYRATSVQRVFPEASSQSIAQVPAGPASDMSSAPQGVAMAADEVSSAGIKPAQSQMVAGDIAPISTSETVASPSSAQVSAAVGMFTNDNYATSSRMISTPSSRAIEANLAAAKASDGDIASMVDGISGFEARVMPANARIEPLSQMQSPSEQRRSRILASALPVANYGPDHVGETRGTDKAARTLDDRLYDSISRMAVGGDRLTLKF